MKGTPLRELIGTVSASCSFWAGCARFSAITRLDCHTSYKNRAENQTKAHQYADHIAGDIDRCLKKRKNNKSRGDILPHILPFFLSFSLERISWAGSCFSYFVSLSVGVFFWSNMIFLSVCHLLHPQGILCKKFTWLLSTDWRNNYWVF